MRLWAYACVAQATFQQVSYVKLADNSMTFWVQKLKVQLV